MGWPYCARHCMTPSRLVRSPADQSSGGCRSSDLWTFGRSGQTSWGSAATADRCRDGSAGRKIRAGRASGPKSRIWRGGNSRWFLLSAGSVPVAVSQQADGRIRRVARKPAAIPGDDRPKGRELVGRNGGRDIQEMVRRQRENLFQPGLGRRHRPDRHPTG